MKKGTQLLEIYALEIQMYTEQKNNKALKALYEQSLNVKSAIPHPLIMGVIRGCFANDFFYYFEFIYLRNRVSMLSTELIPPQLFPLFNPFCGEGIVKRNL